jgi:mannose/fructose-specific phosphotransferase system component IIA
MKFIIATHGNMASGLVKVAQHLKKIPAEVFAVNAYTSDETVDSLFAGIPIEPDETVIVLTDLVGGSVNQFVIKNLMSKNVHIIAGLTMYLLLRAFDIQEDKDIPEQIKALVEESRKEIYYVNTLIEEGKEAVSFV